MYSCVWLLLFLLFSEARQDYKVYVEKKNCKKNFLKEKSGERIAFSIKYYVNLFIKVL